MVRQLRILKENGYFHITQRGNNKNTVFHEKGDYTRYKNLTLKYFTKFPIRLYHYCLMPNHIHFLLQSPKSEHLSKAMQGITQSYTIYCKRKYAFHGSLWQGRYKDEPIEDDVYFLTCARYIERNPLAACLVNDLYDYPHSSYLCYAAGHDDPLITESVWYEKFGSDPVTRRRKYREFLNRETLRSLETRRERIGV